MISTEDYAANNSFNKTACLAIAAAILSLAGVAHAGQWTPLVHGNSSEGWNVVIQGQKANSDPDHVFSVKDGVIHAYKDTPNGAKVPFGAIITKKAYSQYHLRLEFQWGTKKFTPRMNVPRDAGVIYHSTGPDKVWPLGVECQIQEHDVGDIFSVYSTVTATIDPKTKDDIDPLLKLKSPVYLEAAKGGVPLTQGDAQDVRRVRRNKDWEHNGWNTVEVLVAGDRAVHIVNGHVNNRCTDMCRVDPDNPQRMIPLASGKILLQAEGAEVQYRNIEISDLSESDRSIVDSNPN